LFQHEGLIHLRRLRKEIASSEFLPKRAFFCPVIFGCAHDQAEIIVRQFLIQKYLDQNFIKSYLFGLGQSNKLTTFNIPYLWRKKLKANKVEFSEFQSNINWSYDIIIRFIHGIATFHSLFLRNLLNRRPSQAELMRGAYFYGLTKQQIPNPGIKSNDICSWYASIQKEQSNIDKIFHSVQDEDIAQPRPLPIKFTEPPFVQIKGLYNLIKYFFWGFKAIALAFIHLINGRWWNVLLLSEACQAKAVFFMDQRMRAREYLFHYSGSVFRPLWSYETEKMGSKIISYFYSTYDQPENDSVELGLNDWWVTTWPNYLVWDQRQKYILSQSMSSSANIRMVGPIKFGDKFCELPKPKGSCIGVFNICPQRCSLFYGITPQSEYYLSNRFVQAQFLLDINSVAKELDLGLMLKAKRDIGKKLEKKYLAIQTALSKEKHFFLVDPGLSPIKIIEKCSLIISSPFTSTAFYAEEVGVASIFYDPAGSVSRLDPAARGLPVIHGIGELRHFIREFCEP
jgi:polysaccharide biosynthesis PFTS motif protein